MKKFNYSLVLFSILLIFISCANQTTFLNPEYADKKIPSAILLLPQFENSDYIQNEELLIELGIDGSKEKYDSLFIDNFIKSINEYSSFQKIKYIRYNTPPEYETHVLDANKKFEFDLPQKPIQLDISGSVFILFLEDLLFSFSRKTQEATTSTRSYTVSGLSEKDVKLQSFKDYKYYINLNTKYVIYDNSSGNFVSYGTVSIQEKYVPPVKIERFIKRAIRDFAEDIFKKTPFEE